jgi:hypothetical protein
MNGKNPPELTMSYLGILKVLRQLVDLNEELLIFMKKLVLILCSQRQIDTQVNNCWKDV